MKEISDHKIDKYEIRGWKKVLITTKGWEILFKRKYGTQYWIPIKQPKESNPVDTSEYSDTNNLLEEPEFKWWDKKVLKKKDRIIYRVKSHYWKTSHKFGIALPHSVEEACAMLLTSN